MDGILAVTPGSPIAIIFVVAKTVFGGFTTFIWPVLVGYTATELKSQTSCREFRERYLERLDDGGWQRYRAALHRRLDWIDHFFRYVDRDGSRSIFRRPWARCLSLAFVYPVIFLLGGLIVTGRADLAGIEILQAPPELWRRLTIVIMALAGGTLMFLFFRFEWHVAFANRVMPQRLSAIKSRPGRNHALIALQMAAVACGIACVILGFGMFAGNIGGIGASAIAIAGIGAGAFAGAVVGAFTGAVAFAGAVATAVAVAGFGSGVGAGPGTLVAAGALAAVVAVAVVGAVAVAVTCAAAVAGSVAGVLVMGHVTAGSILFAAVFALFPVANSLLDWASLTVTRSLIRGWVTEDDPVNATLFRYTWGTVVDVSVAMVFLCLLAALFMAEFALLDMLLAQWPGDKPSFADGWMIQVTDFRRDPFGDGWMITLMLFSTLLPTIAHVAAGTVALVKLPHLGRVYVVNALALGPPPVFRRLWVAMVMSVHLLAPLAVGCVLVLLILRFVPLAVLPDSWLPLEAEGSLLLWLPYQVTDWIWLTLSGG